MSEGAPSQRLPRVISPRKMAYSGISIEGSIDPKFLVRLTEARESIGEVYACLAFSISEEGKLIASGTIEADLGYQCQRCLQAIDPRREKLDVNIGIVRNEDEARQLPVALDPWIIEEEEADVFACIEEELLLALPVVAYHDYVCIDEGLMSSGDSVESDEDKKENPFSVLSALKEQDSDS